MQQVHFPNGGGQIPRSAQNISGRTYTGNTGADSFIAADKKSPKFGFIGGCVGEALLACCACVIALPVIIGAAALLMFKGKKYL